MVTNKLQTQNGDFMDIILYSNHCPQCMILEKFLNMYGIEYTTFSDEEEMIKMGFKSMPMLSVNGNIYNFSEALEWVKNTKKKG